ncbi:hypothetical protein AMTRI_Chr11g157770 [Amborella trichopoda]
MHKVARAFVLATRAFLLSHQVAAPKSYTSLPAFDFVRGETSTVTYRSSIQ